MMTIRHPIIFIFFATLFLPVITTAQETTTAVPAVPAVTPAVETVDINTADVATLDRVLEGIGEKKAQAIVDWREKHGPFKTIYELEQVSGIGPKTIEKNKNKVVISDPNAAADAATQSSATGDNTDGCNKTDCNKTEVKPQAPVNNTDKKTGEADETDETDNKTGDKN